MYLQFLVYLFFSLLLKINSVLCTYQNISVLISLKALMSFFVLHKTTCCLFRFMAKVGAKGWPKEREHLWQ